jgi:xylan 1,4-beta-xylosidase
LPADGAIWLKCEVDYQALVFSWSDNGKNWRRLPITLDYSLISDEAGKGEGGSFTGAFVGMACQDLSGQNCPADFDYFHYIERDK